MEFGGKEIVSRGEHAVPELIAVIEDGSKKPLHSMAIAFLSRFHEPKTIATFKKILNESDSDDILGVVSVVKLQPFPELLPDLLSVAKAQKVSAIRMASALAALHDRRAVPQLKSYLSAPKQEQSDGFYRASIIRALGEIGDPSAVPAIRKFENSTDPDVLTSVQVVLHKLDPKFDTAAAVNRLRKQLAGSDWTAKVFVAKAITELEGPSAMTVWIELAKDAEPSARGIAADYLGAYDSAAARACLQTLVNDSDVNVRTTAKESLAKSSK